MIFRLNIVSRDKYLSDIQNFNEVEYEEGFKSLKLEPFLPVEGGNLWRNAFRIIPESSDHFLNKLYPVTRLIVKKMIRHVYSELSKLYPGKRVLDKAPIFTNYIHLINDVFPDAYFIHIIRDGRSVVNSLAYGKKKRNKGWWGPRPDNYRQLEGKGIVEKSCHQWIHCVRQARKIKNIASERYIEVRYENVAHNPQKEVIKILKTLKEKQKLPESFPLMMDTERNNKWDSKFTSGQPGEKIWTPGCALDDQEKGCLKILDVQLRELGYL